MAEWQPIKTAPKTEDEVLIVDAESKVYAVASWSQAGGWRDMGDMGWGGMVGVEPTHWMPLPEPPTHSGGEKP